MEDDRVKKAIDTILSEHSEVLTRRQEGKVITHALLKPTVIIVHMC